MNDKRRNFFLVGMQRRGGFPEINASPDPITPTLGAELVTNGGFDSDTSDWTAESATLASVAGGQSGNCLELTNTAASGYGYQNPTVETGEYYQLALYRKSGTATPRPNWGKTVTGIDYFVLVGADANWSLKTAIARMQDANSFIALQVNNVTIGATALFDTVSLKKVTNTQSLLGNIGRKNGTYTCHPTVALYSQGGLDLNYLDANNLVRMVVARNLSAISDKAILLKRIAGTWTEVISGNITYSAGAELKAVVSGTTFQLWYNGTQVGTNQTIDNSGLGTKVYGFNTLAGNTVGTVTTAP